MAEVLGEARDDIRAAVALSIYAEVSSRTTLGSVPPNAHHAARCVACQGVGSQPVPVALVVRTPKVFMPAPALRQAGLTTQPNWC
jgi:hypothetical protein